MQVQCSRCSQPIALCDIIESHGGHLSHLDCTRPHTLTLQERALLFVYCLDHAVAYCLGCDTRFRMAELAVDPVGVLTNLCPRCRRNLTESIRAHLYGCAMAPAEVRLRARRVREAAQYVTKLSQQTRDRSDVLIREAEAALFEAQKTLRAALVLRMTY